MENRLQHHFRQETMREPPAGLFAKIVYGKFRFKGQISGSNGAMLWISILAVVFAFVTVLVNLT